MSAPTIGERWDAGSAVSGGAPGVGTDGYLDGLRDEAGYVVRLVDWAGDSVGGSNSEGIGFGVDPAQPRFAPIDLKSGTWAKGPDQVVIDTTTAKESLESGELPSSGSSSA